MGSSVINCKKCKSKVINDVKCTECKSSFHRSCAKLLNLKISDQNSVNCCVKLTQTEEDVDVAFFDAVEGIIDSNNKIDVRFFNYIIKQKDLLINELREKINILNNQIEFLTSNRQIQEQKVQTRQKTERTDTNPYQCSKINKEKPEASPNVGNDKSRISSKTVSNAILEAQTQLKMNEYVNLAQPTTSVDKNILSADANHSQPWATVQNKRRRQNLIVGTNSKDTNIRGVEKKVALHVCRIEPSIKTEELQSFLQSSFPEVICEKLNSKFPDIYSSFKVTISQNNFKSAMDPLKWPANACIRNFLQSRRELKNTG